jgi:hypothetical protein
MARLAREVRVKHERDLRPSMVMIDAQTVKGSRYDPTFHEAGGRGGRPIGSKRSILVDILGLLVAAHVASARPHDVRAGCELLREGLGGLPRVSAIVADRGYRGLRHLAGRRHLRLDTKAPLQERARLRPARALAAPITLLRGHRGERHRPAVSYLLGRL